MMSFIKIQLVDGINVNGIVSVIGDNGVEHVVINKHKIISLVINNENYEISLLLTKGRYVDFSFNKLINEFYRVERELVA
ncbi:hypothetical protein GLP21_19460 [Photobacterium carnosum]|uniref:hypothetical protein n=1 Tax=Photobacterium TaxID=657 RepID=UPI000AE5C237|nr:MULTISPECIES: hypothetical protein [Photobacterium]MBY3790668.1 hypothetical protein [Photobacterium carnosum]MCD9535774.1 hypothetical protein [Photobacterium carnosum]MCD9550796.1 hypothetical protein [Photobacterium carnosum]